MKLIQKSIILLVFYTHLSGASIHPFDLDSYFGSSEKINQKYNNQWKKLMQEVTEDNAAEKMQHAQAQLDMHRQYIAREKEIALITLKTKYNIPDRIWNTALYVMSELKKFNKETRFSLVGGAEHDQKIPLWFMSMIKTELVKKGHNPAAINIYGTHNESITIKPPLFEYSWLDGKLSLKRKSYGSIGINHSEFIKKNPRYNYYQKGACMLLAKRLQKFGIWSIYKILSSVKEDATSSIPIPEKEWTLLHDFDNKKSVYEIALKDKQGARCVKKWYSNNFLDEIDIEDYDRLADICFQWESLSWLKKYFSNSCHAIPLALKYQFSDIASVKMLLSQGVVVTKKLIHAEKNNKLITKKLLQDPYYEQHCCICLQHQEYMTHVPCSNEHNDNFMCRSCYDAGKISQQSCPLCI